MTLPTFRPSLLSDLQTISSWVQNQHECDLWTGGVVPFPIDMTTLPSKIAWDSVQSWTVLAADHVVGYGQLIPKPDDRLHIARIVVDPNSRGRGYGRLLMSHLLNSAQTQHPSTISLNVHPGNERALMLYQSLGFDPVQDYEASNPGAFTYMQFSPDTL
jgi:ribosomal protein S18 acetylase RimI-like enzyme